MLSRAELSPESLSRVLEQSTDCVKLIGPSGELLWMNPNGLCAMEIDEPELLNGKEWATFWPDESRALIRSALSDATAGRVARLEAFCPTAKGSPRWWEVSISAVMAPDGAPAGYISVSRDVSQLHADREALKVLLEEMRHRLKNSFAMVCALLRSLSRGDEHNSTFADEMVSRISALATAQTLFDGGSEETDLADLLATLISPFRDADGPIVRLECAGNHAISRGIADAISLVVGELAVNSTKHGAIGHGGAIDLAATPHPELGDEHLLIKWRETTGRPPVAKSREGGQGLSLIERICKARGGTFDIAWNESGLVATLTLPLQQD
ncbi:MAG: PAS domain-containing protein [Novosphingobium sp.]|uniref:sensor histidine kinase n=1 Tax=Novosphingobium sp. TaxID=1874826 RepID=UPI002732F18B|nr:PAS domain-containing protein [Novosphingobium sp.]MDP3549673.1 PAS domain-containing protein [Novosphingobium sp.]